MKIVVSSGIFTGFFIQYFLLFYKVNWKDDFLVNSQGDKFFEIGWPLRSVYVPFIESSIRESSNLAEIILANTLIIAFVYIVLALGCLKIFRSRSKGK